MKNSEILRQIDDAASQLGSMTVNNNSREVNREFKSPLQTQRFSSGLEVNRKGPKRFRK